MKPVALRTNDLSRVSRRTVAAHEGNFFAASDAGGKARMTFQAIVDFSTLRIRADGGRARFSCRNAHVRRWMLERASSVVCNARFFLARSGLRRAGPAEKTSVNSLSWEFSFRAELFGSNAGANVSFGLTMSS